MWMNISRRKCRFWEICSIDSVLVKYRGKGAVLFLDSLFMMDLNVYWDPR